MSTAKSRKADAIRRAIDEINPLKSRIMELARDLQMAGAMSEGNSLDALAGRLESWQARMSAKAAR